MPRRVETPNEWQEELAIAIGAKRASTTRITKAFQYLYDTGIGHLIGGKVADTIDNMLIEGVIKTGNEENANAV